MLLLLPIFSCDSYSTKRSKYANSYRELKIGVAWTEQENSMFLKGVELALEESLSLLPKGKNISLVIKNDNGNINTGIMNASELAEDPSVICVLGHTESYISVPASAIYEFNGIVMMNPFSTARDLTQNGYKYLYRVIPSDESIGEEIVDYFKAHSLQKIALCYVANTYGQSFANVFERRAQSHGIDVVDRISFDVGDEAEFHRVVRKWENYDFDSIMFVGSPEEGANFYKVLDARGIKVPVVGSDSMVDEALLKYDANLINDKVFPAIFHVEATDLAAKTFVDKFVKRFGKKPDADAAIAYDSIKILVKGIIDAKSYSPLEISKAIRKIKDYHGVAHIYNFDENGELILRDRISMQKISNSKFTYIGRY